MRVHVRPFPTHAGQLALPADTVEVWQASLEAPPVSVEHLEAYGVAFACRESGVPFVVVLGISNVVGPDAHIQWLTHRDAAQDAARVAIAESRAYGERPSTAA